MIIRCLTCNRYFDDEFRNIVCPHATFLANDGRNNFNHYPESWLGDKVPSKEYTKAFATGGQSEHDEYQEWYRKNKVKAPI